MKRLPSASKRYAPAALSTKNGAPPTAFHARTGEFTAPGMFFSARANRSFDFLFETIASPAVLLANIPSRFIQTKPQSRVARIFVIVHDGFQSQCAKPSNHRRALRGLRRVARDRSRARFPFQFACIEVSARIRLSLNRKEFINLPWPRISVHRVKL